MGKALIWLPRAREDVAAAFDFYESKAVGLGFRFLLAVEHKVDLVLRHPEAFERVVDEFTNCRRKG